MIGYIVTFALGVALGMAAMAWLSFSRFGDDDDTRDGDH